MEKIFEFKALIETDIKYKNSGFIRLPFNVKDEFGTMGQVKVDASFDGHGYRGSIANMGEGHILIIRKDIRSAIQKEIGETVLVVLKRDIAPREIEIPENLMLLLKSNPMAEKFYNTLSYTNRKEYAEWISSAKRAETQKNRLAKTLENLLSNKKNPFA